MNKQRKSRRIHEERDPETGRIYVESVDDIPHFGSDEEELQFLQTHVFGTAFYGPKPMTLEEAHAKAKAQKHPAER